METDIFITASAKTTTLAGVSIGVGEGHLSPLRKAKQGEYVVVYSEQAIIELKSCRVADIMKPFMKQFDLSSEAEVLFVRSDIAVHTNHTGR